MIEVKLTANEVDYYLETGESIESLDGKLGNIIEDMRQDSTIASSQLIITIENDLEDEEEESEEDEDEESEESNDKSTTTENPLKE